MDAQTGIAGLLVAGSAAWAAWALLPAAVRACCRARLGLRQPGKASDGCGGCGSCGGCAGNAGAAPAPQVIRILGRDD